MAVSPTLAINSELADKIPALKRAYEGASAVEKAPELAVTGSKTVAAPVFGMARNAARKGGGSAALYGAITDYNNNQAWQKYEQEQHDIFHQKLDGDYNTASQTLAGTADAINPVASFLSTPRNIAAGSYGAGYSLGFVGAGGAWVAAQVADKGGKLAAAPLNFAGKHLHNGAEALQDKNAVLQTIGKGVDGLSSASSWTGNGIKNVTGATAGGIGVIRGGLLNASEAVKAPANHLMASSTSDISNIPSAAMGQIKKTSQYFGLDKALDKVGVHNIGDKLDNAAQSLQGHEAKFARKFGTVVDGASNKLSSVVGSVAGDGAKGKTANFLSNAKSGIGNQRAMRTINQTAAIGSIAVEGLRDMSKLSNAVEQLVEMYADINGLDARMVSPLKVFFDKDAPPTVAKARKQIIQNVGIGTVISAVSAAISWKIACNNSVYGGFGAMMLQSMAVSPLKDKMMQPDPMLQAYGMAKQDYLEHGKMGVESVANLIAMASPTLRNSGEIPMIMELAESYVNKNLTPSQLMRAVDSGRIAADSFDLTQAKKDDMAARVAAAQAGDVSAKPTLKAEDMHYMGPINEVQQQIGGAV